LISIWFFVGAAEALRAWTFKHYSMVVIITVIITWS